MKGPGIKDYLEFIQQQKQQARQRGEKYIEISSKQLHEQISPEHATMPTCCQAIYKLLYQGDEILQRPKGQTGFGFFIDALGNIFRYTLSRPEIFRRGGKTDLSVFVDDTYGSFISQFHICAGDLHQKGRFQFEK